MSEPLRLALWSPLPPSTSGVADYVAESLSLLARQTRLSIVVEDAQIDRSSVVPANVEVCGPEAAIESDLDLYHVGNSPAHGYVYRAALQRPGVVFLHEWNLHHLVLNETVERGDIASYLREMRRAFGERGSFLGRQVSRALGGRMLPALYPLNQRLLDSALAVVGLTNFVCERAARRLVDRPVLHIPHHFALPLASVPGRSEARRTLGLPENAWIMTAPGLATAAKRLPVAMRAFARLRNAPSQSLFVVAGGEETALELERTVMELDLGKSVRRTGRLSLEDFVRHIAAANVVLALRFPTYGEISGALIRAMGIGRPVLVSIGTPAGDEFPEGVVIPVDCGVREEAHLTALLALLSGNPGLGDRIGRAAREWILKRHDLEQTTEQLVAFLRRIRVEKADLAQRLDARRVREGGLAEYLNDEIRRHLLDLGLADLSFSSLVADLTGRD